MSASPTYPGDRQNNAKLNPFPARGLSIINQPAGGLEFVNTKDDEMVTYYYKDGSYLRFNKFMTDFFATKNKRETVMGDSRTEVNGNVVNIFHQDVETIQLGDSINKVGDVDKWQKYQDNIKNLIKKGLHPLKRLFEVKRTKVHNSIDQSPLQTKKGILAATPSEQIITKTLVNKTATTYIPGVKSPCFHAVPTITPIVELYDKKIASDGWGEFSGWGTGFSPSSQDGTWDRETQKDTIAKKRVDIQKQLFDEEKHLGQNKHRDGGTTINKIAKDYVGVVGLSFNDQESFRIDPKGKLVPYGTKIDPFGNSVYTQYRESSLIEHVAAEDMPYGNYDLQVGNKYDIVAGAGGIGMKTLGPMEVYAPQITISSEQTNINARGEVTLAGERVDLSGEIITVRPKKVEREIEDAAGGIATLPANSKTKTEPEQQFGVMGNLNVELNAIIAGGLHVEGEVTLQHITAPLEYHITDGSFEWGPQIPCGTPDPFSNDANCLIGEPPKGPVYADIMGGCLIGYAVGLDSHGASHALPVISVCAPNSVMVHNHYHYHKGMPMKLIRDKIKSDIYVGDRGAGKELDCHSAVRAVGARNNFADKVLAMPIENSTNSETVVEKFNGNICTPLTINNGDWVEPNEDDILPNGEGIRTAYYTDSVIFKRVEQLEKDLEKKYKELQDKLDSLTKDS